MKIINEHIKSNEYKNVYLLYGDEPYLKKQYRDKLKQAIAGDDTMNYSYYEGDKISVKEIKDMGDTLPFFAEHRFLQ
jgi:DNA polymerase III subunit delta